MTKKILFITVAVIFGLGSLVWLYEAGDTYLSGLEAQDYQSVIATVDSVEEKYNPFGVSRTAVLGYTVKDKSYKQKQDLAAGLILRPGEKVDVFYDSDFPSDSTLSREIDYDSIIVKGAFGLFVLALSSLMLKELVFAKQKNEAAQMEKA
ncbi:MAG: DUF3592 domain-containing protein [Candidatus Obscuribacterales bacterium]|nr:DUF3592 domain-containing protein [Candidatus Obscuribacterales bacterium]